MALFLTGGLLVIDQKPGSADIERNYIQFNMCGSTLACYNVAGRPGQDQLAINTANSILSSRASLVTLNEVCAHELTTISNHLTANGFSMVSAFIATRTSSTGCGTSNFGNAVLIRGSINLPIEYYWSCNDSRSTPGDCISNGFTDIEQRAMVCARAQLATAHAARTCSFHAVNDNDILRDLQILQVANILNPKAATGTAELLGADLNVIPSPPTDVFSPQFRDIDHPSPYIPTFTSNSPSSKIDYMLLTTVNGRFYGRIPSTGRPARNCGSSAAGGYCSDHWLLRGIATLTDL